MTMTTREVLETAAAYIKEAIEQLPTDQPEVPDRVEVWPENDEHLRGDFWKCSWGSIISYRDGEWHWWDHVDHCWHPENQPGETSPLTRTTDPSRPRRFDSLGDVPEDVERLRGKRDGCSMDIARSPLCESGWMQRYRDAVNPLWSELLPVSMSAIIKLEEVIDHE